MSLVSLKKSLEIDKNLYAMNPHFGMDIYAKDFEVNSCIILENNGEGLEGIPIKCAYYELNLSLRGKSKRQINQFEYKIPPHSLQLILEKDMHSFLYEKNSHEYIILFDEIFLTKEIKESILFHRENQALALLDTSSFNKVLELYKQIDCEFKKKDINYIEFIKVLLTQILYLLKREKLNNKKVVYTRQEELSNQFLSLVEESFLTKKTLQEYAFILKITPKYLSKIIKDTHNKSALYCIHTRIIKEIQYLLCYSHKSIKEICSYLNVKDISTLGRFFKKYEKITLKEYRLKYQTQAIKRQFCT